VSCVSASILFAESPFFFQIVDTIIRSFVCFSLCVFSLFVRIFPSIQACVSESPGNCASWDHGSLLQGASPALLAYIERSKAVLNSIRIGQSLNTVRHSMLIHMFISDRYFCTMLGRFYLFDLAGKKFLKVFSESIVLFRSTQMSTKSALNTTLTSALMTWVRSIERLYAPAPLTESVSIYATDDRDNLASVLPTRIAILIVFLVMTLLMYVMYYQPLVWLLNEETRRICSMLLMIPISVLEQLAQSHDFSSQLSAIVASADDYN
jgi:hypothetical protein